MATDDDKQVPEPDPWAGLDIDGDAAHDDGLSDIAAGEIPLVVFPPPDAEPAESEIQIGTGASGIISMADAVEMPVADDVAIDAVESRLDESRNDDAGHDHGGHDDAGHDDAGQVNVIGIGTNDGLDDAFGGANIGDELGLPDVDADAIAAEALASGDDPDLGDALGFGEPVDEANADDFAFDAGMMAGASPRADGEEVGSAADAEQQWQADPASIPLTTAVAAAAAGVAGVAGVAGAAATDRPKVKKKGSGLGQMVGVVFGGLMALPITYAILIWGFHKDPFKFGRQMPPQLAFLLPQKLQPGYKPPRKAEAVPGLEAAPSLDDLPSIDDTTPPPASEEADTAAAEPDEGESAEPAAAEPMEADAVAAAAEPADSPSAEPAPAESVASTTEAQPADEPASEAAAAADAATAMPAGSSLAALPRSDALAGLDALVADAATADVSASAAQAPALPPLDLTGVETAAERVMQAGEALGAISDPADPDRDRLLVVWYRRLARLGEELVRLETTAADSGRPLSGTPVVAADLFDRICVSEAAVADLDRLGGMWLTSQSRRLDGVALIATLGTARQVGPYWSTRATISGASADRTDRTMAIISRVAPPADAGDRVVVSGVMFDGDAIWAADMRPVAPEPVATQPGSDVGEE